MLKMMVNSVYEYPYSKQDMSARGSSSSTRCTLAASDAQDLRTIVDACLDYMGTGLGNIAGIIVEDLSMMPIAEKEVELLPKT